MGKGLGAVMMVGRGMGRVDGMKWGGCVRRGGERQVDIYTYTCARAYTYIYIYISLYGSPPSMDLPLQKLNSLQVGVVSGLGWLGG